MSKQEFGRLDVLLRVQSGRLRVSDACVLIGLQRRQVFRLLRGLKQDGATSLLSKPTSISLEDLFDTIRKPAASWPFPKLLAHVNAGLTSPLEFEREFLSIQRVRNCLEHRGGIVRKQDLDDQAAALTLSFPRLKVFYMRGSEEIELAGDERVDDGG